MKLKRLVSAVLAIGMALTILPTAAFAAGNTIGSSEVGGLEITEAGYPKVPDETPGSIVVNGVTVKKLFDEQILQQTLLVHLIDALVKVGGGHHIETSLVLVQ